MHTVYNDAFFCHFSLQKSHSLTVMGGHGFKFDMCVGEGRKMSEHVGS